MVVVDGGRVSPMIPQCNIHMICCGHGQRHDQRMREREASRGNKRADNAAVQWKLGEDQRRRRDQIKGSARGTPRFIDPSSSAREAVDFLLYNLHCILSDDLCVLVRLELHQRE